MMRTTREPLLIPITISDLRPTQITVGLREVQRKRARWKHVGADGGYFLGKHMIPVVIGPKMRSYIIDHHHLARALHDEGQETVLTTIVADLNLLDRDAFWKFLDNRGWLHPFDASGARMPYSAIPKGVTDLIDDPFRSLAGAVREAGGYAKDTMPFSEFIWADYFRRHIKPSALDNDFDDSVKRAISLARDHTADFMPGWCGPDHG